MKIVKKFKGHSESSVFLVEKDGKNFVYKTLQPNAKLSVEILENLPFKTPKIEKVGSQYILMEYIPGIDMKTYLRYADIQGVKKLIDFLVKYIDFSLDSSQPYNFKNELYEKYRQLHRYAEITYHTSQIATVLPKGIIHGDLTLENILFYNNDFYFIDANYTKFNSIVFDVNKLRQDLSGLWFVREQSDQINYVSTCNYIYKNLKNQYNDLFNDHVYAFMLARILPYCKRDLERKLIMSEINKCE